MPIATEQGKIPAQKKKLLFTKREAAEMLSLSIRTIENLMTNGELRFRKIGKRVLIPWPTLLQFVRGDHSTKRLAEAER